MQVLARGGEEGRPAEPSFPVGPRQNAEEVFTFSEKAGGRDCRRIGLVQRLFRLAKVAEGPPGQKMSAIVPQSLE
jgi:hypothetical protein